MLYKSDGYSNWKVFKYPGWPLPPAIDSYTMAKPRSEILIATGSWHRSSSKVTADPMPIILPLSANSIVIYLPLEFAQGSVSYVII